MNETLLFQYVIFTILNVVIQTAKSIMTIKCNKYVAAVANAIAYGFYTYIIVLTLCELPIFEKCLITAFANLVGVFIVKFIEEKAEKDKLWKIELTVPTDEALSIDEELKSVPHCYYILSEKHTAFNFYCATQNDSAKVKEIANRHNAKYFICEAKQEIL